MIWAIGFLKICWLGLSSCKDFLILCKNGQLPVSPLLGSNIDESADCCLEGIGLGSGSREGNSFGWGFQSVSQSCTCNSETDSCMNLAFVAHMHLLTGLRLEEHTAVHQYVLNE
jgi:hypothetical protein